MGERLDNLRAQQIEAARRARAIMQRLADGEDVSEEERSSAERDSALAKRLSGEIEFEEACIAAWQNAGIRPASEQAKMSGIPEARYGRPLAKERRFVELVPPRERKTIQDLGKWIRAISIDDIEARASMSTSGAGYMVPVAYALPLLDLMRNKTQVMNAGAVVVPMESNIVDIPRHDSDPAPAWRAESGAVGEAVPTIGSVQLTARSLDCMVRVPVELMEDSGPDMGSYLGNVLGEAFAVKLDYTALYGSGTAPEPRGVKNTTNVVITHFVGANGGTLNVTNGAYDGIVDLVGRVRTKNFPVKGILYAPHTGAQIGKFQNATTKEPLQVPPYLEGLIPGFETSQIPLNLMVGTSNDCSDMFAGDWSQVKIGIRTEFSIQVLSELYAANGEVGLWAHLRADVQVARPTGLEVLDGLRA